MTAKIGATDDAAGRISVNVTQAMRKLWKTAAAKRNTSITTLMIEAMDAYLKSPNPPAAKESVGDEFGWVRVNMVTSLERRILWKTEAAKRDLSLSAMMIAAMDEYLATV